MSDETTVIVGVLLLAALGVGVWLYLRKRQAAASTPTREPRATVTAPPVGPPTPPVRS